MICVEILPAHRTECIETEEAKLSEIIEAIRDKLLGGNIMVLVDDKLVEDYEKKVTSRSRIIIVEEFLGG